MEYSANARKNDAVSTADERYDLQRSTLEPAANSLLHDAAPVSTAEGDVDAMQAGGMGQT
jgi:hypothetical protein